MSGLWLRRYLACGCVDIWPAAESIFGLWSSCPAGLRFYLGVKVSVGFRVEC